MKNRIRQAGRSQRNAFTLIELLVVIAIIAILAAILFPVFAQAKAAAKKTQALSNAKQIGIAVQIYLNDADDTFPLAFHPSDGSAYSWNRFKPARVSQLGTAEPAWKRDAANTFVMNSIQPYAKNTQILNEPNGNIIRTSGFYGPTTPQPAGLPAISYTYNGLIHAFSGSAMASSSTVPVFWHGHGKRALYGYGYASPWLVCDTASQPCTYVSSGTTCATGNGGTSGYTTNTSNSGVDLYSGSIIFVMADTSAKSRRVAIGNNPATQRTDPRVDPWARYRGNFPCGRYWGPGGCHPYLFRPDWDGATADSAVFVDGGTATQCTN